MDPSTDARSAKPDVAGSRVPDRIAERLAHEVQDLGAGLRTQPWVSCRIEIDIHVDEPAVADFLGECREARDELAAVDRLRLQPVDEVADVADREVDGLDGGIDAFGCFVGFSVISSRTSSSDRPTA